MVHFFQKSIYKRFIQALTSRTSPSSVNRPLRWSAASRETKEICVSVSVCLYTYKYGCMYIRRSYFSSTYDLPTTLSEPSKPYCASTMSGGRIKKSELNAALCKWNLAPDNTYRLGGRLCCAGRPLPVVDRLEVAFSYRIRASWKWWVAINCQIGYAENGWFSKKYYLLLMMIIGSLL